MDPEITDYGIADKDSRTTIINIKKYAQRLKGKHEHNEGEINIKMNQTCSKRDYMEQSLMKF